MSTLYTTCQSFAAFVQSLVALCYLPTSEILAAMAELEQFQFDSDIPREDMEKIEKFKCSILQYIYDFWIDGDFHPEIWNYWMHSSGNTNNVNEGWNSGFGETVGQSHPNLHILSDFLSRELKKAMNELAENLDEDTREKILVESVKVFEMNNVIIGSVKGVDR